MGDPPEQLVLGMAPPQRQGQAYPFVPSRSHLLLRAVQVAVVVLGGDDEACATTIERLPFAFKNIDHSHFGSRSTQS